jgi:type IV pilus assembly protein PilB
MSAGRPPADDRRLLGDLLVEAGIATRQAVGTGLEEQRLRGGRLGYNLVKLGLATPAAMHLFLKDAFETLSPEMAETLRTSPAVDLIPARLAHFYGMIPVSVADGVLALGLTTADTPALIPAVEELTGLRVEPLICPPSLVTDVLARFYPSEVDTGVLYRPGADHVFVLSDRRRRIRPVLPETLRADAPAADRFRSLAAEAIRRGARRIRIEPEREAMQITLSGRRLDDQKHREARGALSGVMRLLEGISGIASRGRIVPREGRFLMLADQRRIVVSVSALPGLEGDSLTLDLREERIASPSRAQIEADTPDLPRVVDRLAEAGHGLLIVTGSDETDANAGVSMVLGLFGERCPRRVAVGLAASLRSVETPSTGRDEEEIPFEALLERAIAGAPDMLVLPDLGGGGRAAAAREQAAIRIVIATFVPALDASAAVESLGRSGIGPLVQEPLAGILAVRLMEPLCTSCQRPVDPFEFLPQVARHRRPAAGSYGVSEGCPSCRGSGLLLWQPVLELHARRPPEDLFQPRHSARDLRSDRGSRGLDTLFLAGLAKAASGIIDVREPLRLLFHEH